MTKKNQKHHREQLVLLSIVELYLITGMPIGSNTLKETGLKGMSSATIRNYFTKLESQGFLKQQHASGGRIPTPLAYRFYANHYFNSPDTEDKKRDQIKNHLIRETKELGSYLQEAAEFLSDTSQCAVFFSAPRFDQDLIIDIKLIGIDSTRCLCVLITDFGLIHTEILSLPRKLSLLLFKEIEQYFRFRMTGLEPPRLNQEEQKIADHLYKEILLRHIVGYANFTSADIYKTGFSKLLRYPEFHDAGTLAIGLSLFENTTYMRSLLNQCESKQSLKFWIGDDLEGSAFHTSVLAIPYFIHGKSVGAMALLGPTRLAYPKLFNLLRLFSSTISDVLTTNLYKYKMSFRQPQAKQISSKIRPTAYMNQADRLLLEDQSELM